MKGSPAQPFMQQLSKINQKLRGWQGWGLDNLLPAELEENWRSAIKMRQNPERAVIWRWMQKTSRVVKWRKKKNSMALAGGKKKKKIFSFWSNEAEHFYIYSGHTAVLRFLTYFENTCKVCLAIFVLTHAVLWRIILFMSSCVQVCPDFNQTLPSELGHHILEAQGCRLGENAMHHPHHPSDGGHVVPGDGCSCFCHLGDP